MNVIHIQSDNCTPPTYLVLVVVVLHVTKLVHPKQTTQRGLKLRRNIFW